jgi:hypothetical protein
VSEATTLSTQAKKLKGGIAVANAATNIATQAKSLSNYMLAWIHGGCSQAGTFVARVPTMPAAYSAAYTNLICAHR